MDVQTFVIAPDLHFPKVSWPTWKALENFISLNKVHGFVFLGDQFDNHDISHHTEGIPGQRTKGQFALDEQQFELTILTPLEKMLPKDCQKVWVTGNHDDWERDLGEKYPELEGIFDRTKNLNLKERGWKIVALGNAYKYGKLYYVHGETLSTQHHSKRAVETYCRNLVYGHFHTPQSWTKVLPQDATQKWQAHCLPILGATNQAYLENKPTNWVSGFGIVEYHTGGNFNLYSIVVTNGRFAYAGKIYKG